MVENAFQWTFWLHFALFIPKFRREHEELFDRLRANQSLSDMDPAWMAIYFSVLASTLMFTDENETINQRPAGVTFTGLLRNWYDSALLFLDRADYTKRQDVRTPQAIAILHIVFNNVGDVHRHQNMWAVAIRQAQQLGLGSDESNPDESFCEQQIRRRLWWTLAICEWLPIPHRVPCLHEMDFTCKLPDEVDDEELETASGRSRLSRSKPRPVRYHIAMAQVSKIYYQLRYMLRLREWGTEDVARFVFDADEQLANLITDLPSYLQFDEKPTTLTEERDRQYPFIPWQKKSLAKVLLYYRMAISSQLQEHWLDGSTDGARTRAICMSSARGLIHSTLRETVDASKLRPWAITMNIFAASAVLALESLHTEEDFSTEIQQGLDFLERVQAQNLVAEKAGKFLKEMTQHH
uniref:C6 zinc finger domain-containing protein n=2 Tax=Colletotrichum fructicola (strain Nara gc5) TaxID=1213859 RepID=L2FYI6_COLFN